MLNSTYAEVELPQRMRISMAAAPCIPSLKSLNQHRRKKPAPTSDQSPVALMADDPHNGTEKPRVGRLVIRLAGVGLKAKDGKASEESCSKSNTVIIGRKRPSCENATEKASTDVSECKKEETCEEIRPVSATLETRPKSLRLRGLKPSKIREEDKSMKPKIPIFTIALSQKEIEEDFLAMIGSKPPRRPHKKPKNVQKILDDVFPGSGLSTVTLDRYKVNPKM